MRYVPRAAVTLCECSSESVCRFGQRRHAHLSNVGTAKDHRHKPVPTGVSRYVRSVFVKVIPMSVEQLRWFIRVVIVLGIAFPINAGAQVLDTVVDWHRQLQVTAAGTPTPTVFFTRPYALTSIAVFDALNSIEHVYQPYVIEISGTATASREAAVAQAAHDVLVALYPGQLATLDAALATSLSGRPAAAVAEGVQIGAAVASAVLQSRANDGWDRQPTPYLLPNFPGSTK